MTKERLSRELNFENGRIDIEQISNEKSRARTERTEEIKRKIGDDVITVDTSQSYKDNVSMSVSMLMLIC